MVLLSHRQSNEDIQDGEDQTVVDIHSTVNTSPGKGKNNGTETAVTFDLRPWS